MTDKVRRPRRWPWLMVVLLVVAGGAGAARRNSGGHKGFDPTLLVSAKRGDLVIEVLETGRVQPREKVEIKSKVAGQVSKVFVDAGAHVRKGELLLQLDPRDYGRDVARTQADVAAAQNALAFAELKLKRVKNGFESRGAAQVDVETAENDAIARRIALKTASVALQVTHDRLRYTFIESPIDGVVTERGIQPGEVVTPGVQATFEGRPLLTVSDLSTLIVKVELNQIDVAKVKIGQKVTLTLDALPGHSYSAIVSKVAPASTIAKGKEVDVFPVEAILERTDGLIKPGMTADVRVHIESRPGVLVLPVEAVVKDGDRHYAEKVVFGEQKPKTERIEIKVGARNDREVEITGGLAAGDQVLINPGSSAANEYVE